MNLSHNNSVSATMRGQCCGFVAMCRLPFFSSFRNCPTPPLPLIPTFRPSLPHRRDGRRLVLGFRHQIHPALRHFRFQSDFSRRPKTASSRHPLPPQRPQTRRRGHQWRRQCWRWRQRQRRWRSCCCCCSGAARGVAQVRQASRDAVSRHLF